MLHGNYGDSGASLEVGTVCFGGVDPEEVNFMELLHTQNAHAYDSEDQPADEDGWMRNLAESDRYFMENPFSKIT